MTKALSECRNKQRRVRLLDTLRSDGRATAEDLAKTLQCTVRTVYRDIEELQAYGLPIEAARGAGLGYFWKGNAL